MRLCYELGCDEHSKFINPKRDYVNVSFVTRTETCCECGREVKQGYYWTGEGNNQKFSCTDCA